MFFVFFLSLILRILRSTEFTYRVYLQDLITVRELHVITFFCEFTNFEAHYLRASLCEKAFLAFQTLILRFLIDSVVLLFHETQYFEKMFQNRITTRKETH